LPRCYCPDNCNEYVRTISSEGHICGTDNQTYETLCELNKKACQTQKNLTIAYVGDCRMLTLLFLFFTNKYLSIENCHHSNCSKNITECNPYIQCLSDYHPLCASNLQEYSNECEMNKYACQSNIHLTKFHDGPCDFHEKQQQFEGNRI
jgi:hypothetical protein